MKPKLALAVIVLVALLAGAIEASASNCNPACPPGYSQQGSVDCSEQKTCKVTCYRPGSCGGFIDEVEETTQDSDNSDYVELSYGIDFGDFEDRGRCSGNECLTNYCYKFIIDTEATAKLNKDTSKYGYMSTYCSAEKDIVKWYDSDLIDDEKKIRLSGSYKALESVLVTIYPKDKKPSLQNGEGRIEQLKLGNEDVDCEFEVSEDVDNTRAKARWNLEMYQFLPEDTKQATCDKTPEPPRLNGIPDKSTAEDTAFPANFIDLNSYYSDNDGPSDTPTFSMQLQSNPGLITCSIASNRYINCNLPTKDASGFSDITVKVTDTYGNTASDDFRITITPVNDLPQFSAGTTDDSAKESPTPVGGLVTFTASIQDADNDNVRLVVCDEKGIKNGDCAVTKYCSDPVSGTEISGDKLCTFDTAGTDKITYEWASFACDATACTQGEPGEFYMDIKAIQNLKLTIGGQEAASHDGAFTGEEEISMSDHLNKELESCIPDEEGYCTIVLSVEAEGEGTVALKDLHISYEVPNEPPVIEKAAEITAREGEIVTLNPKASDPDDFALAYSYSQPFDKDGKWQTAFEDAGERLATVTVSDGEFSDTDEIKIMIVNVNRPPAIEASPSEDEVGVNEGEFLKLEAAATDPDNDALSYAWHLDGQEVSTEATYTYAPGFDDSGTHTITLTASDSELSASKEYAINVMNVNRKPAIASTIPESKQVTIRMGKQQLFQVEAEDPDKDELTYKWALDTSEVQPAANPNSYLFKPGQSDIGNHVLTVEVSDGSLATTAEFSIIAKSPPECNPGETKPCPLQLGVCKGSQVSCYDEKWHECDYLTHSGGKYQPVEDACDSKDNNCNGQIDENCPACNDGKQNQGETGVDCGGPCPACSVPPPIIAPPIVPPPVYEPPSCSDGTLYGSCSAAKPLYCSSGSLINSCGSCGCALGQDCQVNGACKAPSCSDGVKNQNEKGIDCGGACQTEAVEICDGVDNDKDCKTDEDVTESQGCGLGACTGGVQSRSCTSGQWGSWNPCSTSPKASAEKCDGTDNNCDGRIDETRVCNKPPTLNPLSNRAVYAREPLAFQLSATDPDNDPLTFEASSISMPIGAALTKEGAFTWTPSGAQLGSYAIFFTASDGLASSGRLTVAVDVLCAQAPPIKELCDGIDNDCDGKIDNGLSYEQNCGYKGTKTTTCVNGAWKTGDCIQKCSTTSISDGCFNGFGCGGHDFCSNPCGTYNIGKGCPHGGECGGFDACGLPCGDSKIESCG